MPLKFFNKIWVIIVILFIVILGFYILNRKHNASQQNGSSNTSQSIASPLFETWSADNWPGWHADLPGVLLIRNAIDSKNLLLTIRDEFEKGNKHRAVYLYAPNAQNLQQVSDEKWDTSTNPITECFSQSQQFSEKFKVNGEKLLFGNQEIPIKGTVLISLAYSPSGDKVGVLSADGPRNDNFLPFLGGGQNSKGQHYHQLFSVVNGSPIGDFVKLPFTTQKQAYSVCWSADEKYVFYTAVTFNNLTIVKTDLLNK